MADQNGSSGSDYAVGYGRPPQSTQFVAGKSGNPRGRPKGPRSVSDLVRQVLRQKIPVTENGKTRRRAVLEVILRRLAHEAIRNDPKALKLFLSLVERYAQSPDGELKLQDLTAEDHAILAQYWPQPPTVDAGPAQEPAEAPNGNPA